MTKIKTLFIRSPVISSRHELVNSFLFSLREELEIAAWYTADDHLLRANSPVEVFYAASSRKPYFLLEFRHPTEDERRRCKKNPPNPSQESPSAPLPGGNSNNLSSISVPHDDSAPQVETISPNVESTHSTPSSVDLNNKSTISPQPTEDFLQACTDKLLSLSSHLYKERPVEISLAPEGITVESKREKLRLRDASSVHYSNYDKKENTELTTNAFKRERKKPTTSTRTTLTSFIPRAVRRQRTE
ncbi:unnamed protein product [Phytomonas sp. Hart1]|nr:unnamed protein product [Phytomonas sp. Hart1]|eukprot:CCW71946.1 unnamed protein product [Phytomonas sp. isolate Hart1]